MSVLFKYQSGEDIEKGDRVRFHGNIAEIEFVASDPSDPSVAWYVKEFGGGVMVLEGSALGRTFISSDQIEHCEDLEFVSRGQSIRAEDRRPKTND
jgi:hypothetical protein